jgi:hypothetical protein
MANIFREGAVIISLSVYESRSPIFQIFENHVEGEAEELPYIST